MATTLEEHSDDAGRGQGFRAIVFTHEDRDTQDIVALTIHHAENIASDGDEPSFMSLPGAITDNIALAEHLIKIVSELLARPRQSSISQPRMMCHEG